MSKTQIPNKGGRPRVDSSAITLRLQNDLIETLDMFRKEEPDLPNRPEAIRRLVRNALEGMGFTVK